MCPQPVTPVSYVLWGAREGRKKWRKSGGEREGGGGEKRERELSARFTCTIMYKYMYPLAWSSLREAVVVSSSLSEDMETK